MEKIPHSRRYQLVGKGYAICVDFSSSLKEFMRLSQRGYSPIPRRSPRRETLALDRLYQRISDDLDALLHAVGLKVAA